MSLQPQIDENKIFIPIAIVVSRINCVLDAMCRRPGFATGLGAVHGLYGLMTELVRNFRRVDV